MSQTKTADFIVVKITTKFWDIPQLVPDKSDWYSTSISGNFLGSYTMYTLERSHRFKKKVVITSIPWPTE